MYLSRVAKRDDPDLGDIFPGQKTKQNKTNWSRRSDEEGRKSRITHGKQGTQVWKETRDPQNEGEREGSSMNTAGGQYHPETVLWKN